MRQVDHTTRDERSVPEPATGAPSAPPPGGYEAWVLAMAPGPADRAAILGRIAAMPAPPRFLIVMPDAVQLDPVRYQLYPHWQLRGSPDTPADGTAGFVVRLGPGCILAEHALYLVAEALHDRPELDLIYGDEDTMGEDGRRTDPWFKPGWNPDLFLSRNLFPNLAVYRRSLLDRLGPVADDDLPFRAIEATTADRIHRIPFILSHQIPVARPDPIQPLQAHLDRAHPGAVASPLAQPGWFRIHHPLPAPPPRVAIIIPTRDKPALLRAAIDSIQSVTDYPDYEIIVVDNRSTQAETQALFTGLARRGVRVVGYDQPYSFAALNNWAVRQTGAPVLAFLNNDIEVIGPGWLSEMVAHAVRPEVGAVGAKLVYPDGTIQHAGIVAGIIGLAGHPHLGLPNGGAGYHGRAVLAQDVAAVTAACLVMRRTVFDEVGGFDAARFGIAFNDVDLGLRLNQAGYRVLWTPHAELLHHESASLGRPDSPDRHEQFQAECQALRDRWPGPIAEDPFYNPNLTLADGDFALATPSRARKPWLTAATGTPLHPSPMAGSPFQSPCGPARFKQL